MKTATLRQLVDSLTDVRHYHLASALLESDPARQSRARDQAHRAGAVLEAIRFELSARDACGSRTADAALHADRYLQRLLADFLGLGDPDEMPRMARRVALPIARVRMQEPPARTVPVPGRKPGESRPTGPATPAIKQTQ